MEISEWLGNAAPRNPYLLNRSPSARCSTLHELLAIRPQGSSKQYRLLKFFLIAHRNQMIRFYCLRYHTAWSQDVEKSS